MTKNISNPPPSFPRPDLPPRPPSPKNKSANEIQHGGTHYKSCKIQPWDYIAKNELGFFEGTAIKYLTRWKNKGGIEDLKKAVHFIEKLIEIEESK